jgi:hypothetical protein
MVTQENTGRFDTKNGVKYFIFKNDEDKVCSNFRCHKNLAGGVGYVCEDCNKMYCYDCVKGTPERYDCRCSDKGFFSHHQHEFIKVEVK